jgi:hypothetical protein
VRSHDSSASEPSDAALLGGGAIIVVLGGLGVAGATKTDYTATIITLIGAVFVALLTAVTTNRRQTKQLGAEDQRFRLAAVTALAGPPSANALDRRGLTRRADARSRLTRRSSGGSR